MIIEKKKSKITILKIIGFYSLALLLLGLYWHIDTSDDFKVFLEKAERIRIESAFGFSVIIGLIKYGSLISGISIILILTILIIKEKILNINSKHYN